MSKATNRTGAAISIRDLSFAYWDIDAPANHAERTVEDLNLVFDGFSLDLPAGVTSVLGENGIGKSTLLLLAGARLFPAGGQVLVDGVDSMDFVDAHLDPETEERRNRLVSFVFQNMEFETEETLGELIDAVAEQAAGTPGQPTAPDRAAMVKALDLGGLLGKKPQVLSKGELQRGIIALAASYGSRILIMDEPVFALEERHKQMSFGFLHDWSRQSGTTLIYTAHDIHLCRDFADTMLLLFKDKSFKLGPVAEVCTPENLEAAYKVPMDTLYQKESLYRDMLLDKSRKA
jgi:ABC-type cobalamin/Fe3+-siderophores transport system ATPase subunit